MGSNDNHQTGKNHHLVQAMGHAIDGITDVISHERNMRYHLLAAVLVIVVGLLCRLNKTDWLWILLAILTVFAAEFLNTVTEAVTDLLSQHHFDPNVKRAKDVAAGAVLLTALFSVLVGVFVFGPYLMKWMLNH